VTQRDVQRRRRGFRTVRHSGGYVTTRLDARRLS
jgi:hypothetical protein